jgi:hypothetical protein
VLAAVDKGLVTARAFDKALTIDAIVTTSLSAGAEETMRAVEGGRRHHATIAVALLGRSG